MASSESLRMIHVISIICCLLSIILTPLIEIIPMILYCAYRPEEGNRVSRDCLFFMDYLLTAFVCLLWMIVITIIVVATFGMAYFLLILLVPYLVVMFALRKMARDAAIDKLAETVAQKAQSKV